MPVYIHHVLYSTVHTPSSFIALQCWNLVAVYLLCTGRKNEGKQLTAGQPGIQPQYGKRLNNTKELANKKKQIHILPTQL